METRLISARMEVGLVERVDALVRSESQEIGLPVDRTGFIARAVRLDVERRESACPRVADNDNLKGAG